MKDMKTNHIKIKAASLALLLLAAGSCADENLGPVLPDRSSFVAPSLKNSPTGTPTELLIQNAGNVYEEFQWDKSSYGVQLSVNYVLEVDDSEDFDSPQELVSTSSASAAVTVEDINNAMLALGLPAFEESTVHLRVRSVINGLTTDPDKGYDNEPLYSQLIERTATTYQSSECGNFCTVGIIGSASPGGWDVDSDLRLADATKVDKSTWTTTLYLNTGAVKFRALDDWTTNWGSTGFPAGTGTQNGSDIPISTAGYYKVTFNDQSGDYTFVALTTPELPTVGIIGSGTPGGWDNDTDLTKSAGNPHVWTGVITFTEGAAKFRANNDWAVNWGTDTYPSGFGIGNGADIPVKAGTYSVWFNDATGEYFIMPQSQATPFAKLGLIGPAQEGGWDADTDLVKNPANPFIWSKTLTIDAADAKFRADDAWDANWGASTFPGGVGSQNGPNIPTKEGSYFITFNSGTGEYYFLK